MWAISLTFSPSVFHLWLAQWTGGSGAEYFSPRAGEQRTVIFLHATRRRKRKRAGEKSSRCPINGKTKRFPCLSSDSSRQRGKRAPGKQLQLIHSRAEHSGSNKSADPRVQPASASCSWGAVTSQIPASLFIPFCSGSKTPAVFTPALAGPAPGTRGGPAGGGGGGGAG